MGFQFGDDRRDVGIGLDHGGVHFVPEGVHFGLEVVARWLARIMRCFHLIPHALLFRAQAGICRQGRIVRLVHFLLFGLGQGVHPGMVTAGRRRTG